MMKEWTPIKYRGFHDVPRIFLATHGQVTYLFSCPFDDELDDYPSVYRVYVMPNLSAAELETNWELLFEKARSFIAEIPVASVQFDTTRRKEMKSSVFDLVDKVHAN
jgi:hypothetical protein